MSEDDSVAPDPPVVIVGGGIAGCACALALAGRGEKVTLLEAADTLGGRVSSVRLKGFDRPIDNVQHTVFRTYERFLQLLATCEARDHIKLQKRTTLPYLEVDKGRISVIQSGSLPPPNHLSTSILNASFLGLGDKMAMQRAVKALRAMDEEQRRSLDEQIFIDWLFENGQTERAVIRFWNPLVRAALNIDSTEASAASAAFLFRRGLFGEPDAFDVGSFTTNLSQALAPNLRRTLARAGVEVRLSTPVTGLYREGGAVTGVTTRDGFTLALAVILCTPISATARLLTGAGASVASHEVADRLANLGTTALLGIHAFHEGPVLPQGTPFATCLEEPLIQMLFDRSAELDDGQRTGLPGHWISVPVSHADKYLDWDDELIQTEYERVVNTAFPDAPPLLDFRVVRINRATTALNPGAQRLRPNPLDAGEGVILGGDWIDIDWPTNLEGASRAGLTAAATLLEQRGNPDLRGWKHEQAWPDWPEAPRRGDEGWREW